MFGWDIHPSGREAVYSALADGIAQGAAEGDHSRVLISFQPSPALVNLWNYGSSSRWFHTNEWLDFNSLQSGHTDDNESYGLPEVHALVATDYALSPVKPVIDLEPSYENTADGIWNGKKGPKMGADVMRRKAYWAIFAGAWGHTYGHNDIVAFHEPGRPDYSGQQFFWKDILNAPGAVQMRHVRTLMESRPQLIRVPDQSILASAPGTGLSHVRATRASDGSYAFVYIPDGRVVTIPAITCPAAAGLLRWRSP